MAAGGSKVDSSSVAEDDAKRVGQIEAFTSKVCVTHTGFIRVYHMKKFEHVLDVRVYFRSLALSSAAVYTIVTIALSTTRAQQFSLGMLGCRRRKWAINPPAILT